MKSNELIVKEIEVKISQLKAIKCNRNSRAETACRALKSYLTNLIIWIKEEGMHDFNEQKDSANL